MNDCVHTCFCNLLVCFSTLWNVFIFNCLALSSLSAAVGPILSLNWQSIENMVMECVLVLFCFVVVFQTAVLSFSPLIW